MTPSIGGRRPRRPIVPDDDGSHKGLLDDAGGRLLDLSERGEKGGEQEKK